MITGINTAAARNKTDNRHALSFKGAGLNVLSSLNWMKNTPSMGACFVDLAFMAAPRTAVETKNRGAQAGIETFIRESSSAAINASIGLTGLAAGSLISKQLNKKSGVKIQDIFASGDTIQNISKLWIDAKGGKQEFFENFVKNLKGLNGETWRGISADKRKEIVKGLVNLADCAKETSKEVLLGGIVQNTGAKDSFKLAASGAGTKEIQAGLPELVDNAVKLAKAFETSAKNMPFEDFVRSLKQNKKLTALLGLGISALLSVSVHPINTYLTKKRTGKDGFAGTGSKERDNSKEFKALKTAAGIGFPLFAISTIGAKPKDLLSALQFNGKYPRINQFKLIYGLTIASRLVFARDKDELRESLIKDSLGFSTWLIFGDFAAKTAARISGGKDLINNPVSNSGKKGAAYIADWLMHSSVKSFDEILLPKSKEITKNGSMPNFKELYQKAAPEVRKLVRKAACAQAAGYLFSGIVLGMGITKLNIAITKYINGKKNADKSAAQSFDLKYLSLTASKTSAVFDKFN